MHGLGFIIIIYFYIAYPQVILADETITNFIISSTQESTESVILQFFNKIKLHPFNALKKLLTKCLIKKQHTCNKNL